MNHLLTSFLEMALAFRLILGIIAFLLLLIPIIVARWRGHPNFWAITVLDVLLGWTFVGWVVALVWSLTRNKSAASLRWGERIALFRRPLLERMGVNFLRSFLTLVLLSAAAVPTYTLCLTPTFEKGERNVFVLVLVWAGGFFIAALWEGSKMFRFEHALEVYEHGLRLTYSGRTTWIGYAQIADLKYVSSKARIEVISLDGKNLCAFIHDGQEAYDFIAPILRQKTQEQRG
jgi:hypothetical protein